ncbi:transposase [Nonomuraea sp. ZG12]|uniref:transposase n=1 Tax=Nonomuraea sp. ZG12 TaxID=3452207 RepID=UPI003F8BFFF4
MTSGPRKALCFRPAHPFGFRDKFRHKVFTGTHLRRIYDAWKKSRETCARTSRSSYTSSTARTTHVHLLVNFPPKVALSTLVNDSPDGESTASAPLRGTVRFTPDLK